MTEDDRANMRNTPRTPVRRAVLALLLLTAVAGCSPKTSSISGKVTYQDVPVSTGMVAFISQTGKVITGNIDMGEYKVTGVEIGPGATVAVTSHVPSPMMHPPTGPGEGVQIREPLKFVPIPERYGDPEQSGLTCDVVEGEQTRDFILEP